MDEETNNQVDRERRTKLGELRNPSRVELPCRPGPPIENVVRGFTATPVEAGNTASSVSEFGRHADVLRIFGIRRGKLYELWSRGLIRSVSLRRPGQKHSVRLWHLDSVRTYLKSLLE